jgi:hypothetical protein
MLWNAWKYFWLHILVSIQIWKVLPKLGQTGRYVHFSLLKTPLQKDEVKAIFELKFDS